MPNWILAETIHFSEDYLQLEDCLAVPINHNLNKAIKIKNHLWLDIPWTWTITEQLIKIADCIKQRSKFRSAVCQMLVATDLLSKPL